MAAAAHASLVSEMERVSQAVEETLTSLLPRPQGPEARLHEVMRDAVFDNRDRLRGFLAVQSGRVFGVQERAMLRVAAAIEFLHTVSRMRARLSGAEARPGDAGTVTLEGDDAAAMLASNALMMLAIAVLTSDRTCPDPFIRCTMVARCAEAMGHAGVTGGQMIAAGIGEEEADIGTITRLQRMKSGSLLALSCESGALMARANEDLVHAISGYAHDLGLALQIMDDLGTLRAAGGGADQATASRASFLAIMEPERARSQAELLARQGIRHLDVFDEKANPLRAMAEFVVQG